LLNMVNNAIKFTEQGSVRLCVSQQGENALISVQDTGEGIPTENLESIFQEFTQVDTSTTRKAGGTGLGLPISRRLIEMHGGRMWAESPGTGEGMGSTFFVELPLEARIIDTIEIHERKVR
jgi:signal transduction histidine kinase